MSDCPEALKHFWSGHAQTYISERYIKLLQNRDFRLMWTEKLGLGFELPTENLGQRGYSCSSVKRCKLLRTKAQSTDQNLPNSSLWVTKSG